MQELLVIVRIRNHGRTYWTVSDGRDRRVYAPQISERVAVERFCAELGRTYARVQTFRQQHSPAEAARRIKGTFGE